MTTRRAMAGLLVVLLLVCAALTGCTRKAKRQPKRPPRLDRAVMACLGAIRAYHRQADVHLGRGDRSSATGSVGRILELPCLERKNPELHEAVLDAFGRLARLHMQAGRLAEAERFLRQGLARPGPDTFFRANLLLTQGDLLDARASKVEKGGDKKKADGLRREAITAFDRSAEMNKKLLEQVVK